MDLNEIKQLIAEGGGKIIIVENDKPTFVVMSYEEYKGKKVPVAQTPQPSPHQELTLDDLPI